MKLKVGELTGYKCYQTYLEIIEKVMASEDGEYFSLFEKPSNLSKIFHVCAVSASDVETSLHLWPYSFTFLSQPSLCCSN